MNDENAKEWIALQRGAYDIIRKGHSSHLRDATRLLHIAVLPSFEPLVCWDLCRRRKEKGYFAVRVAWLRHDDAQRFESPVERLRYPASLDPTILKESVELPTFEAESLLKRFQTISIPPSIDDRGIGVDGTTYEVSLGDSTACASYSWWHHPPAPWKPLHDATIEAFGYLEALDRQSLNE